MRIFDRIASGEGVYDAVDWWDAEWLSWLRKSANAYPRFVVDEASEYLQMHGRREWTHSQLGDSHPPFDNCWVEWKTPDRKRIGNKVTEWASAEFAVILSRVDGEYRGLPLVSQGRGTPIMPVPMYLHLSDDMGLDWSVIDGRAEQFRSMVPRVPSAASFADGDAMQWAFDLLPMLLAFGWMNTREFRRTQSVTPAKLRKRRVERGQFPGHDYYKVEVHPDFRRRFESESGVSATRFHLVRGHFVTFTKPSGGHANGFVGTTWRRGHARGDKALGTINKEYHVTAEAAQ
jgi:hypothetical protein